MSRSRAVAIAAAVPISLAALALTGSPAVADDKRDAQWHLQALDVSGANALSQGQGVTVAVVDTGVDPHPDLRGNLSRGYSGAAGVDKSLNDSTGHGTQMASLIAAHGRSDQRGVVGIAPKAKIMPVRMFDSSGEGATEAEAIEWAATHGAQVINFSGATAPSIKLQTAVEVAAANDALIVAASGNKSQDVVAAYPAAIPGVLAVGSSDKAGKHADFSVATKNVQICAPGIDIMSAKPGDRYVIGRGTSYSAALVSGAAALVRAKYPDLSAGEVIHRLTSTATDIGKPGRDDECGYGVLNIVKALTADVPPIDGAAPTHQASTTTTTPPTNAAPDKTEPTGSNTPAIAGGIGAAVLLLGGLLSFLFLRRRHKARKTP